MIQYPAQAHLLHACPLCITPSHRVDVIGADYCPDCQDEIDHFHRLFGDDYDEDRPGAGPAIMLTLIVVVLLLFWGGWKWFSR
jgi:hypothetical protein